jgi:hypothetical protein
MKNLFKFDCDAARLLSIIFVGAVAAEVVKSVCLTVYALAGLKKGKNLEFKL